MASFALDQLRVHFAGTTNIGRKREHNEDSLHVPTEVPIAVVCDGMGGHASGDIASQTAVAAIVRHYHTTAAEVPQTFPYKLGASLRDQVSRMHAAIMIANLEIFERSQREARLGGMGTTCVAAHFLEDAVIIGHVGDSRLYRLRDRDFEQLTEDHSLINDYVKMKRLTPEEAAEQQQKNVLSRALGMKDSVQVDVQTQAPRVGDIYLICSDGLTGMLPDNQIAHMLRSEANLQKCADRLIDAANEEGGVDNITALLARVEAI